MIIETLTGPAIKTDEQHMDQGVSWCLMNPVPGPLTREQHERVTQSERRRRYWEEKYERVLRAVIREIQKAEEIRLMADMRVLAARIIGLVREEYE